MLEHLIFISQVIQHPDQLLVISNHPPYYDVQ
jgi:hypothetical protein